MPHYYLQGLDNDWKLVRETPFGQHFRVATAAPEKVRIDVDIHYTPSKVLTVTLVCVATDLSKAALTPVLDDIGKIALRRADYAVIDYSLSFAAEIIEGNFTIEPKTRKIFGETL